MGGKGGSDGPSPEVQQEMEQNQASLVQIAQGQAANAQQLYGLTEPGLATAEGFYSNIASGDPNAIATATAPAAQQISQATSGAIKNIEQTAPAGGEKNLAIEMAQANQGAQVGSMATNAYVGSQNTLAQLAGQGVGEGIQSAGVGVSGISAANQGLSSLGQMQIQGQELQAQQKGSTLGALGGLAGDAMSFL